MRKAALLILLIPVLWVFLGCAGSAVYTVRVRAAGTVTPHAGTRYALVSGIEGISPEDAEFREFSAYVRKMLTGMGYVEGGIDSAEEVIILSYGLRLPVEDSFVVPASAHGDGDMRFQAGGTGGRGLESSEVRPLSRSPMAGPRLPVRNVYRRYLLLVGADARPYETEGRVAPLWKVMAVSAGYSTDLGKIFPIMLAACRPFIGTTTAKEVVVRLRENDRQVMELRGGATR